MFERLPDLLVVALELGDQVFEVVALVGGVVVGHDQHPLADPVVRPSRLHWVFVF